MTITLGRIPAAIASPALAMLWCDDASAFRPFDGTDAAVVEPDKVEIELGPAEYVRQGDERMLIAPNARLNLRLRKGLGGHA